MPRDGSGIYHRPFPDVVEDTTIESTVYNGFVADVELEFNTPRPVIAGGTGADSADAALINLQAEKASQLVTNYDSYVWTKAGSFFSAGSATGAPVQGNPFVGIVMPSTGLSSDTMLLAFDLTNGTSYTKRKISDVWTAWLINPTLAYVDTKVAKAGDTMTGSLTIAPPVDTNATLLLAKSGAASNNIYGMGGSQPRWLLQLGDNTAEAGADAGSDFKLSAFNDAGDNMGAALSGNRATGLLTVKNNPTAPYGIATKNYVDIADGALNTALVGKVNKTGDIMSGDLTLLRSNVPSTGALLFGNSGNRYLFYDGGTFNFVGGGLQVGSGAGTFSAGGGLFTNDVTITRAVSGAPGDALINLGNSTNKYLFLNNAAAMFYVVGCNLQVPQGYKPGGGDWIDSSDARIKNVGGEYSRGLADIIALRPVIYSFKGNDTPGNPGQAPNIQSEVKTSVTVPYPNSPHYQAAIDGTQFAGLVAQEAEAVMPELVKRRSGMIDGVAVTDLRDLDTGPLVFALINAVKELHAEVEALKAAR